MRKNKKGLSQIIVTILLILLIILATGIFWTTTKKVFYKKPLEIESLMTNLRITGYNISENLAIISLTRDPGGGELLGVAFVFYNETSNYIHKDYRPIAELETKTFVIEFKDKISDIIKIEIRPIFKTEEKKEDIGKPQSALTKTESGWIVTSGGGGGGGRTPTPQPTPSPPTPTVYWANLEGEEITTATLGDTVYLYFINSGLPQDTEIYFEIYEKDSLLVGDIAQFDDFIRVGENNITGTVDSSGKAIATWTITQEDYNLASGKYEEGNLEFYFTAKGKNSDYLYVSEQECIPDCIDKECGDDGCGGSCGSCPAGEECSFGICINPLELKPDMKIKLWAIQGNTFTETRTIYLPLYEQYGIDVIQNGWAGIFAGDNFPSRVGYWAGNASLYNMELHTYIKTYGSDITPVDSVSSLEIWPDNFKAIMMDSENKDSIEIQDARFSPYKDVIPSDVKLIAPEGPHISSSIERQYTEIGQVWGRVFGWDWKVVDEDGTTNTIQDCRRVTDLPAIMYIAERQGFGNSKYGNKEIYIGAQLLNTYKEKFNSSEKTNPTSKDWYESSKEFPENVRSSIYLIAQASLKSAHGVHWGLHKYSLEDSIDILENLKLAYDTVNSQKITYDAHAINPVVGVLIDEKTNVNSGGMRVMWEMVIRGNIPFEVIYEEDLTSENLANYEVLLIPHLDNENILEFASDQQLNLKNFGENKLILTEHRDAAYTPKPSWVTPLLSGSHHILRLDIVPENYNNYCNGYEPCREPKPTFSGFSGFMYVNASWRNPGENYFHYNETQYHYDERMEWLIRDYQSKIYEKTGVSPCNENYNIICKEFIMNGKRYVWNVNTTDGTMEIKALD